MGARITHVTAKFNELVPTLRERGLDVSVKSEHDSRNVEKLMDSILARYAGSVGALASIGQDLLEFESTVGQPMEAFQQPVVIVRHNSAAHDPAIAMVLDTPNGEDEPVVQRSGVESLDEADGRVNLAPGTERRRAAKSAHGGHDERRQKRTKIDRTSPPEVCQDCNKPLVAVTLPGRNGAALFAPHSTQNEKAYHLLKRGRLLCPFVSREMPFRSWGVDAFRAYKSQNTAKSRNRKKSAGTRSEHRE
eukprot:m.396661 g.396661  ORF g.396661 m.396661 type:complete len:248 (-) comp16772_c1_seq51:130-873(-)